MGPLGVPSECDSRMLARVQGIKEGSKLPPGMTEDPGKLSKEQLAELGVSRLPASVGEAHQRLDSDTRAYL